MSHSNKDTRPALEALFVTAVRHHQAARLAEAERCYREILQSDPRHADTLHLLGLLAYQAGDMAAAVKTVGDAIDCDDTIAAYHVTLGNAARALAHHDLADHAFHRALSLQPDCAEAQDALGLGLAVRGKTADAVQRFRTALSCKPSLADFYNNLGLARQGGRQTADALRCFTRALKIRPLFAELHNNLGRLLAEGGCPYYQRAILCAPDLAEAYGNYGNQLSAQGDPGSGLVLLRRALVLRPDRAANHYNLANHLRDAAPNETVAACHAALVFQPDYGLAHNLIGVIQLRRGDLAGAERSHRRALVCDLDPAFYANLAAVQRFYASDDALGAMERMAEDADALSFEACMVLHFTLGKAYDDCGDAEKAFRYFAKGNAQKRRFIDYDEGATLSAMDRAREAFNADLMVAKAGHGETAAVPIFILGMPRSGSTLIEQILASHPKVHGADEIRDFPELLADIGFPEPASNLSDAGLRALGAAYLARIRRLAPAAERVTDKLPSNFLYAGVIHLALPQARIIHSRRDPADTCFSCFTKLFRDAQQPYSYDLGELGRYYRGYSRLMAHWRAVLPASVFLDVDYETMVNEPESQTRRILDHCGLDWDPACLTFYETAREVKTASAAQVRRPIYTESIGRWRRYQALLDPLLTELAVQ